MYSTFPITSKRTSNKYRVEKCSFFSSIVATKYLYWESRFREMSRHLCHQWTEFSTATGNEYRHQHIITNFVRELNFPSQTQKLFSRQLILRVVSEVFSNSWILQVLFGNFSYPWNELFHYHTKIKEEFPALTAVK